MPQTEVATSHDVVEVKGILKKVAPFGTALALSAGGFGVIATFLSLYFAQKHWSGAALSLTIYGMCFVISRLLFSGCISRFGGFPTVIVSLLVESAGLLLITFGHSQELAYAGCGITGLGFSLVFPSLGVEAANAFPASVKGSVLGIYSAFVDFSLFLTGPVVGVIVSRWGYRPAFLTTFAGVIAALAIALRLHSLHRRVAASG